ncbi:MAG: hypothetical protein GY934_08555 [Gammaproteobacteria bacterium]|nr:hypothetical protein [Gammaproteobacteria bacterium]
MLKAVVIVIIILIIAGVFYFESQRSNDLKQLAKQLGLNFKGGQQPLPAVLQNTNFDLLAQGPTNINNWMSGSIKSHQIGLFGFSYNASTSGEGEAVLPLNDDQNSIERRSQSVIWIGTEKNYPDFDLSPKQSHDRTVATRFGLHSVTFDGDSEFNKHFVLLARDNNRVSHLFSERVRKQLLDHPGMVIESRGNNLLFYRHAERLSPRDIPQFLSEVEKLVEIL